MLRGEGYAIDDPVASEGEEREVLAEYREARRIATIVSEGGDVDPGDIGAAVEGISSVYETLIQNADYAPAHANCVPVRGPAGSLTARADRR